MSSSAKTIARHEMICSSHLEWTRYQICLLQAFANRSWRTGNLGARFDIEEGRSPISELEENVPRVVVFHGVTFGEIWGIAPAHRDLT